ncbi:MAG: iron ABC transporter permease [Clostridia bacterium]|nr:iron ABC transporter permease [Clostridia bacterium]
MRKTCSFDNVLKVLVLVALPVVFFLGTICIGRYPVSLGEVLGCFKAFFTCDMGAVSQQTYAVVMSIRAQRALQGLLVGASLAASGACFQSLFRNPLVSSGMLGVSAGSGFGAALSIIIFGTTVFTPGFSFGFGVLAVVLAYLVGKIAGGSPTVTLILGGTIIQSIFSALLSLLKYLADTETQLPAITFWLMGSLASTKTSDIWFAGIPMVLGMLGMILFRYRLNVLSMGDREAKTLGLNVGANKIAVISCATLATAGAVCVSGVIGWIGLIIPHICRMIFGNDNKWLVPASISIGACFMVLVDTICRTLTAGEIPLGIVTAIVGGPFFIYLLKKTKGGGW